MGISTKDRYVNIESYEVNYTKRCLRIRTRIFNKFGDDDYLNTNEHVISFETLKDMVLEEAQKAVDVKKIRKEVEKLDKTKTEKDILRIKMQSNAVADNKKALASQMLDNLFNDLDKTRKLCYEYLHMSIGGKKK